MNNIQLRIVYSVNVEWYLLNLAVLTEAPITVLLYTCSQKIKARYIDDMNVFQIKVDPIMWRIIWRIHWLNIY